MQRRTSRNLSRAVIVAVVLAVGATIWQSWTAGTPGMAGVVQTTWGPLSPADRDLIVKVRLACLWEMSTGQQMQQQATSPAVREAGRKITDEHTELDQKTRDIADKLGVLLPSTPSAQQIAWMKEITAATGSDYDRIAVQRLREAHGIVLPLLATVRVGTRNDLVRAFAIDGSLIRQPAPGLPGEHRAGQLLGAARHALARPAVRIGGLARPDRARAGAHRLPARRGRPWRHAAQPELLTQGHRGGRTRGVQAPARGDREVAHRAARGTGARA